MSKIISTDIKRTIISCVCGEVIKFVCPNCEHLEKRILVLEEDHRILKEDNKKWIDLFTHNQNLSIIRDTFLRFEYDYKIYLLNMVYENNNQHDIIKRFNNTKHKYRDAIIRNISIKELRNSIDVLQDKFLGDISYEEFLALSYQCKQFNMIAHPLSKMKIGKTDIKKIFQKEMEKDYIEIALGVVDRLPEDLKYDSSKLKF